MIRMLFGMLIGAVLTMVLVFGNLKPESANGQDGVANVTGLNLVVPVREAMLSPFQKTVNETASTASGQFLNKLVSEYGLQDLPQANQEGVGLVDIIPDFKTINEKAITLPLSEAGKSIRDRDIAAFYYDFLKRSGFDAMPGDGQIP